MARLFSIDIPFYNQAYSALVSVQERGHDLCCQVRYVDKRLHSILPGDTLVFHLAEGLKQPGNLSNELAEELVRCTSDAISHYFEMQQQ